MDTSVIYNPERLILILRLDATRKIYLNGATSKDKAVFAEKFRETISRFPVFAVIRTSNRKEI